MFESKINRGRANGYAPLGSSGKVPLDYLPPIQSTLNTGSFATTGSNTFTGVQTLAGTSGTSWAELNIGQDVLFDNNTYDIRATGSSGAAMTLTSDLQSFVGVVDGEFGPTGNFSAMINSKFGYPYSDGPVAVMGLQKSGSDARTWVYNYDGQSAFPGDITIGYSAIGNPTTSGSLNITKGNINVSGSINTTGSLNISTGSVNIKNGNINVSGSVNISSSLVVSSTVVNNGSIGALNSDLIIDGGYLILTGSVVPTSISGSVGDKDGTIVFDTNFLYYCTKDYVASTTASGTAFTVTASGATHIYDLGVNTWNSYHTVGSDPYLSTGPSEEGGGTNAPIFGWYFVDDSGTIRQILDTPVWFSGGDPTPYPNGNGWMCVVDSNDWVYSDSNPTLTFHESLPTVNFDGVVTPATLGSGEIWTKTKLDKGPNYAPFGSGSWESQAIGEVTQLDITKDIHLLDTTGAGSGANFHWYLPDGLYDGQVVRFALKGDADTNPTLVRIWMNQIRTYNGTIVSSTTWYPFWDDGNGSPRSLATALFIDGAWNIDTDYWDM